jgi:hypothetical protein
MAYEPEQKTIKSLVPLIMAGYFSDNIVEKKIREKSKENVQTGGNNNGN